MKYRIENGEATVPISEINRLNDEAERLESDKRAFDEKVAKFVEDAKDNAKVIMTINKEFVSNIFGWTNMPEWKKEVFITVDEACKEIYKYYNDIVDSRIMLRDNFWKNKFNNMTVKDFKEWKKSVLVFVEEGEANEF